MSTDTRPSVTVIGELCFVERDGRCYIDVERIPDTIGLRDGDEVEVTIRRREEADSGN
jgi:hypothetical protein